MPVTFTKSGVSLSGVVTVEEAEPLARWLRETERAKVRMSACTHLHSAALQALLAFRPAIVARPADPFLARWIAPLIAPPLPQPTAEKDAE